MHSNRLVYRFVIFIFLFSLAVSSLGQTARIEGRIFNESNNKPLPFTNIIIYGTNIGSTSDLDGKFTFTGIEPGYVKLQASAVGFEAVVTEEIQLINGQTKFINIAMTEVSVKLEEVKIVASPFRKTEESPLSMQTLGVKELEKSPGGNRDVSKVIQSLPGVGSGVSFRNDVIVRGGGASENRFYLDGIEIPNLNHFATQGASGGPVGIINIDFIREIDLYSGAFPANRGNALSSVFEMKQIDGNKEKLRFKGAVGASDMALTLDGPAGEKSSYIFSVRRSYLQFLFDALGLPFLPTYNDYQFKFKTRFNLKNELSIISIGSLDQFSLNTSLENPDEGQQYLLDNIPVNEQWTYAIGAVYKHYRDKSYDSWIISRNYLNNTAYKYRNNDESDPSKLISDYTSYEIENKFRYENISRINGYKIVYGAGAEYAKYFNNTFTKVFLNNDVVDIDYESFLEVYKWNFFGQLSKKFFNDKLTISAGLRADANNYSSSMSNVFDQLSPRLSASWRFQPKWALSFNTGRYFQQPPYTALGYRDNNGSLVNKENQLKYIRSDHIVAGIEFLPEKNTRITVEGFYKFYDNYMFSVNDSISLASKGADFGVFGNEEVSSTAEGRSYGLEVLAWDKDLKGYNIILSYTFVRSEYLERNNEYVPTAWDNRHILNLTLSKKFKKNWYAGFKWRFVGGAPYTPYDYETSSIKQAWDLQGRAYLDYNNFNSLRQGNFHQLDIRIDKQFYFNAWALLFYIDIQNLYNFKSQGAPILILQTDDNGQVLSDPLDPNKYLLKELSTESGTVLPTLGIIVEF